jgi:hypothetical protein
LNPSPNSYGEEEIGRTIMDSAFKVLGRSHHALRRPHPSLLPQEKETIAVSGSDSFAHRLIQRIVVLSGGNNFPLSLAGEGRGEGVARVWQRSLQSTFKIPTVLGSRLLDLINFNEDHLKNGVTRIVNGLEGKSFSPTSLPSRSSRDL